MAEDHRSLKSSGLRWFPVERQDAMSLPVRFLISDVRIHPQGSSRPTSAADPLHSSGYVALLPA